LRISESFTLPHATEAPSTMLIEVQSLEFNFGNFFSVPLLTGRSSLPALKCCCAPITVRCWSPFLTSFQLRKLKRPTGSIAFNRNDYTSLNSTLLVPLSTSNFLLAQPLKAYDIEFARTAFHWKKFPSSFKNARKELCDSPMRQGSWLSWHSILKTHFRTASHGRSSLPA
jgi:hypothetical protein